jgi:hypothetical protein
MRDTTGSVPDVESRGVGCAAPSDLSGISPQKDPQRDIESFSRMITAAANLAGWAIVPDTADAPRYCRVCLMGGIGDRLIQHLPSCEVGKLFRAMEAFVEANAPDSPAPPLPKRSDFVREPTPPAPSSIAERMRQIPRRICIDRMTPAEHAIRAAMASVEEAGCHVHLTDAVILLGQARDKVADFVDGVPVTERA